MIYANLYLTFNETRTGGEVAKGEEGTHYPHREDTHIEVSFTSVSWIPIHGSQVKRLSVAGLHPPDLRDLASLRSVPEHLHLVVARYFDGDTFGRALGYWQVLFVFGILQEATDKQREVSMAEASGTDELGLSWARGQGRVHDGIDQPWTSYFAGLERIEIHTVPLAG